MIWYAYVPGGKKNVQGNPVLRLQFQYYNCLFRDAGKMNILLEGKSASRL